uniref:Uncharacterized protein n=1 Tax=Oryza glumipatula TaxID=40148 RepID=A0A0D9YVR1_9ORYZ
MYCLSLCDELVKFNVCWSKFTMFSSSCNPVVACLLLFLFLSGAETRRVPRTRCGDGDGGNLPPVRGWGRGTFCFLCCGDGYGVLKPDGGSPVAIPNLPPVPPYHSHSQIRLFLRTFFLHPAIYFRCDGSDDLICLDCEECESYLAAKLRRGSN